MGTTHGARLCPSQREAARRPSFLLSPFVHWALHLPLTLVCVCFQGRVTLSCCRLSTLGEHFPLCRPSVRGSEEVPGACTQLGCACSCRPPAEAEGSHLTHRRAGGDARPPVARAPGPGGQARRSPRVMPALPRASRGDRAQSARACVLEERGGRVLWRPGTGCWPPCWAGSGFQLLLERLWSRAPGWGSRPARGLCLGPVASLA